MKMSHRAKRMSRRHCRARSRGGLNLVALMDIFTILVVFLLVNSSDVENLPSTGAVRLPESVARQQPKQATVIIVTPEAIVFQGRRVAATTEVAKARVVPALRRALAQARARSVAGTPGRGGLLDEVTIMADRRVPYSVVKAVMTTCSRMRVPHIALAVLQMTSDEERS